MAQRAQVSAVALVVYCPETDRLLVIKELVSKRHYAKVAGMLSPPIETRKENETRENALVRLQKEEVGFQLEEWRFVNRILRFDEHDVTLEVAWVTVHKEFRAQPTDTDVAYAGWYSFAELRTMSVTPNAVRVEVRSILDLVEPYFVEEMSPQDMVSAE